MVRRLEYKNHLQKNKRYSTIVHRSSSGEIFIFICIIQSRGKRMSVHFYDLNLRLLLKSYKGNLLFLISKTLKLFSSHDFSSHSCSVLTLPTLTKHSTNSPPRRDFSKAISSDCRFIKH